MRRAEVYYGDRFAGLLEDYSDRFVFTYDSEYLKDGRPISVRFPLQKEPFVSKVLHPFFDGLIVEGWLLKKAEDNWKLDPSDRFGLLMLVGKDTIGAVSVQEVTDHGN